MPSLERGGPIQAWIVDDTGLPKKGKHSVGVARQYRGRLGKQDNGQVAVSVSLASETASLPIAYRLYLPKTWAQEAGRPGPEAGRRRKAGVPEEVVFKTKLELALEQITAAHEAGVAPGVVLADAGYGNDTGFRGAVSALGLKYAMGVLGSTSLWPAARTWRSPGQEPLAPKLKGGRGRPGTRVRPAHRDRTLSKPRPREWLLIKWPPGEDEPTKY